MRTRPILESLETRLLLAAQVGPLTDTNPFGVASSAPSSGTYNTWMPAMVQAGVKWARMFPEWNTIQPTRTTWSWNAVDNMVSAAAANGMYISGFLGYNASWINTDTHTFPSNNIADWSTYVSAVVNHTKNSVKYWEVWNEPPNFATGGTAAQYASLVVAAYDAAKAADPACQIGLAASSVSLNYLEQVLKAGAAGHFDYITLHPYEVLGQIDDGFDADYMSIVPTVRKLLAADDPAKVNVPIWFTEIGQQIGYQGTTATSQAINLVKAYTMGIASGVTRINWYEAKDGDTGFGLLTSTGTQRTAYKAMQNLTAALGAVPGYQGWVLLNNKDYGFVFQNAGSPLLVTWTPPGTTDTATFSTNVQAKDPLTGTTTTVNAGSPLSLTNAPTIVFGVPSSLVTQAQANRSLPFPWNGDFSTAASVSVQMGTPNTESGLHQLHANASSTAVTAYGVPARDASIGAAQTFMVDPNFLSYTTTPIQVTVVVRRKEANANAGFNLKYESTTGYKGTGAWYTIPGNTQWYTQTWTISDPQFVARWGYNISLDSDSTTYSQYYIRSITVTNLFTGISLGTAGAYNIATNSGAYTVNVTNGTVNFASDVGVGRTVSLNLSAGATATINSTQHFSALTLGTSATLQMPAGTQKALLTKSLSAAANAVIDIGNASLVVDYTSAANPTAAVESLVRTAFSNGTWTGAGIRSSTAAANTGLYSVGLIDNAKRATPLTNVAGVAVPATSVIVRFTYVADLDLDGLVTSNDAVLFANNYAEGAAATHQFGDLNYSTRFDSNDAILFANTYNESLPNIATVGFASAQMSLIPETSLAAVAADPSQQTTAIPLAIFRPTHPGHAPRKLRF